MSRASGASQSELCDGHDRWSGSGHSERLLFYPQGTKSLIGKFSFFDQISFYGNKVLNLNKDLDTKWFEAFKAVNQAILSFVLMNAAKVSTWSGSQDGSGA